MSSPARQYCHRTSGMDYWGGGDWGQVSSLWWVHPIIVAKLDYWGGPEHRGGKHQQNTFTLRLTRYLLLPTGGVDAHQTARVQEAAVVQAQADEVGGRVGGRAHQDTAAGESLVHLRGTDAARGRAEN